MHPHRIPTHPPTRLIGVARLAWFHHHRLAATAALTVAAGVFVAATPWLLTFALLERHRTGRTKKLLGLILFAALGSAIVWLWREARRHPLEPRGPWHPCRQCGFPISNRSRARYCSPPCRHRARLSLRAQTDDRAAAQLARLDQPAAAYDPATAEIPF
jgi:hypothetical protein